MRAAVRLLPICSPSRHRLLAACRSVSMYPGSAAFPSWLCIVLCGWLGLCAHLRHAALSAPPAQGNTLGAGALLVSLPACSSADGQHTVHAGKAQHTSLTQALLFSVCFLLGCSLGCLGCSLASSGGGLGGLLGCPGGPGGSCCRLNIDRNIDRNPSWFLSIFLSIFVWSRAPVGPPWRAPGGPSGSLRLGASWGPWVALWGLPGALGGAGGSGVALINLSF